MEINTIGMELKRLRLQRGITQSQLCEGICHQSMLSKIEKGETYPSAPILYKISKKLSVDMECFFVDASIDNYEYVKETINIIRQAVQIKDYQTVKELVSLEERNPSFEKSSALKQFLLWHKGIALYYVNNDSTSAIKLLESALGLSKTISGGLNFFSEREFEILNTLAVIYSEINNHKTALKYFNNAKDILKKKPLKDDKILLRIIYNMAKVLTRLEDFQESVSLCKKGIHKCLSISSMYLYGELTYHLGYNYELLGINEEAINHYQESLNIFKIKGNNHYNDYINSRIKSLLK